MTGRQLTDGNATHVAVGHAVLDLLAGAGREDVVVISFAGHESPDGRLVLFDTGVTALAETTLEAMMHLRRNAAGDKPSGWLHEATPH